MRLLDERLRSVRKMEGRLDSKINCMFDEHDEYEEGRCGGGSLEREGFGHDEEPHGWRVLEELWDDAADDGNDDDYDDETENAAESIAAPFKERSSIRSSDLVFELSIDTDGRSAYCGTVDLTKAGASTYDDVLRPRSFRTSFDGGRRRVTVAEDVLVATTPHRLRRRYRPYDSDSDSHPSRARRGHEEDVIGRRDHRSEGRPRRPRSASHDGGVGSCTTEETRDDGGGDIFSPVDVEFRRVLWSGGDAAVLRRGGEKFRHEHRPFVAISRDVDISKLKFFYQDLVMLRNKMICNNGYCMWRWVEHDTNIL